MLSLSCRPFTVTRFVVTGGDEPVTCVQEGSAHALAASLAEGGTSAEVYRVEGEPVTDLWLPPRLLAEYASDES